MFGVLARRYLTRRRVGSRRFWGPRSGAAFAFPWWRPQFDRRVQGAGWNYLGSMARLKAPCRHGNCRAESTYDQGRVKSSGWEVLAGWNE